LKQIYEFLESFVVIALVLAGMASISYHLFREDGCWKRLLATSGISIPITS